MNSLSGSLAWRKAWRAPPFFKKKKKIYYSHARSWASGAYTWKGGFSLPRSGAGETRGGLRLRSAGCRRRPKHRHGPAGLHPFPLSLTYPGLPFQLSVQIGALELLDYLGNNESEIRLLLQHFPCPSPPSSGGRTLAGREPATYGVPIRASDTSRGPYYAGTPPAGVTRQLPGRASVPLWSPPRLKVPAPAFRWQKTTCGVGGGE